MSINSKLTGAFAVVALFLLVVGVTAIWFVGTLDRVLEAIDVSHYQLDRVAEASAGLHNGPAAPAQHLARIRDIETRAESDWERDVIAQAKAALATPAGAPRAQQLLDDLSSHYRGIGTAGQQRLKVLHRRAVQVVIIIMIESALLLIILMYLVRRWLLRPVVELEATTREMLHAPAPAGGDEVAALAHQVRTLAPVVADLRERLEQAERLARVGESVTFVAHNLAEPLRSIRTLAQYEREARGVTPDAQAAFTHIISMAEKLERWIGDMASTARSLQPLLGRHALEPILRDVVSLLQPQIAAAALTVDLQCEESLPEMHLDRGMVEQALTAVLNNAIEASPDGGRIVLQATGPVDDVVEIGIADQGAGMGADTQRKALLPFFTTKRGAAGLGLTVADRIARLHQGALHIESEHKRGTRVSLRLPVAGPTRPA